MTRRKNLQAFATAAMAASSAQTAAAAGTPIQLHVDLDVDPAKEKDMLNNFRTIFQPAIRKQPGFVEVKLLKLEKVLGGKGPANTSYRLLIGFQTEDQRVKWVATAEHQKAWPKIEENLRGAKYSAVLFNIA